MADPVAPPQFVGWTPRDSNGGHQSAESKARDAWIMEQIGAGHTRSGIARALGIHSTRVLQIEARVLRKRRMLERGDR